MFGRRVFAWVRSSGLKAVGLLAVGTSENILGCGFRVWGLGFGGLGLRA